MKYLIHKNVFIIPGMFLALIMLIPLNAVAYDYSKIKEEIDSSDWVFRMKAVEKLANRTDEEAISLLLNVARTRSEYWPVKIKAILLLGETKDPRAKKLLLSIFNDSMLHWECPSIKTYTAQALGNFRGDQKVVNSLIRSLDDHEKLTREASIQSLGTIGDPEAVPHIIEKLKEDSFAIKLASINALESIGDPRAITPLKQIAQHDADILIRDKAEKALNKLQNMRKL